MFIRFRRKWSCFAVQGHVVVASTAIQSHLWVGLSFYFYNYSRFSNSNYTLVYSPPSGTCPHWLENSRNVRYKTVLQNTSKYIKQFGLLWKIPESLVEAQKLILNAQDPEWKFSKLRLLKTKCREFKYNFPSSKKTLNNDI